MIYYINKYILLMYVVMWYFVNIRADVFEILIKNATNDNSNISLISDFNFKHNGRQKRAELIFVNEDDPISIKIPEIFWNDNIVFREWIFCPLIKYNINFKPNPNIAVRIWTPNVYDNSLGRFLVGVRPKIYSNWIKPHSSQVERYDYLDNGATLYIKNSKQNHSGLYGYVVEDLNEIRLYQQYFYLFVKSN